MKKLLVMISALSFLYGNATCQIYKSNGNMEISFFSKTPMEDIDAVNKTAISIINTSNDSVLFKVKQTEFVFPNTLMTEHYNENYVESGKFPYAVFKGKIIPHIDFKKNGTYNVDVPGTLNIHGVTQTRNMEGTIVVNGDLVSISSKFDVKLVDHNIEVPKLLFGKIAEFIPVKVKAEYVPYKKN